MKRIHPNWSDWKNHFAYHYWIYIILIVVLSLSWSLLYSVTEPKTPLDRRMDMLFVGLHDHEAAKVWAGSIQEILEGDGQVAGYLSLPDADSVQSTSTSIMMFSLLTGKDGDLFFVPYDWFVDMAGEGSVIPLDRKNEDGTALVDLLTNLPEGMDLDYGYANYLDPDTNQLAPELCGIPIADVKGFRDLGIDPKEYVACVPFYCENRENAMRALNWILENKMAQSSEYWYPLATVAPSSGK